MSRTLSGLTKLLLVILVDQAGKLLAPKIIPTVANQGLFLGLGSSYSLYLVGLGFLLLASLLRNKQFNFSSALLLGGAVSNLIDRLRFGYVVDYIDLKYLPVFNLADLFIVLGTILILLEWGSKRLEVNPTNKS